MSGCHLTHSIQLDCGATKIMRTTTIKVSGTVISLHKTRVPLESFAKLTWKFNSLWFYLPLPSHTKWELTALLASTNTEQLKKTESWGRCWFHMISCSCKQIMCKTETEILGGSRHFCQFSKRSTELHCWTGLTLSTRVQMKHQLYQLKANQEASTLSKSTILLYVPARKLHV